MLQLLKEAGRRALVDGRIAPRDHPVFSADSCRLYKNDPPEVRTCVRYIEENYLKHNPTPVACDFVTTYDRWPFHKRPTRTR
jgi:hypothetical protein